MRRISILVAAAVMAALTLLAETIPPGTPVSVRLGQTISSATARSGDAWEGTLASDLVVNGKTIAKKGAPVKGIVANAKASGRLSSPGRLSLRLTSIENTPVRSNIRSRQAKGHGRRNAEIIGGTAGVGAAIGAIAGGGKGAAIGAGAGAAAGTAGAAATGKKNVTYPVETVLTFRIQ